MKFIYRHLMWAKLIINPLTKDSRQQVVRSIANAPRKNYAHFSSERAAKLVDSALPGNTGVSRLDKSTFKCFRSPRSYLYHERGGLARRSGCGSGRYLNNSRAHYTGELCVVELLNPLLV